LATPPPNADELLGKVRQLTQESMAGDRRSFKAFRELVSLLLSLTIMKSGGMVGLILLENQEKRGVIGGRSGPTDPLPLNDGRFLRLSITLERLDVPEGPRRISFDSSYQYQLDREGKRWIFRYDYLRDPASQYPPAHFQIKAKLTESSILHRRQTLEHVHFPTSRVSLEAIIYLLVTEFGIRCNQPANVWRPVLAESERLFFETAHIPLSVSPVSPAYNNSTQSLQKLTGRCNPINLSKR
jgi:hypothetical protein